MLGILYDVHGNLTALEAVLADAEDVDEWLLGGDYCTFGPWPVETLARLRELPNATWLRGNGERWLVDAPLNLSAERSAMVLAAMVIPADCMSGLLLFMTMPKFRWFVHTFPATSPSWKPSRSMHFPLISENRLPE
jgi:hypothetical protein